MKKIPLYILLSFVIPVLIAGCGKKVEKPPVDVMSRDSIINLIADLQIAEATIQLRNLGYTDSTKNQAYGNYKFVFQKHKVDPKYFERSFHYYTSHPEIMSKMYTEVLNLISQKQAKEQQIQKLKLKRDTIK